MFANAVNTVKNAAVCLSMDIKRLLELLFLPETLWHNWLFGRFTWASLPQGFGLCRLPTNLVPWLWFEQKNRDNYCITVYILYIYIYRYNLKGLLGWKRDSTQQCKHIHWQQDRKCGQHCTLTESDLLPHTRLQLGDSWPTRACWHTDMKGAD